MLGKLEAEGFSKELATLSPKENGGIRCFFAKLKGKHGMNSVSGILTSVARNK